MKVVVSSGFANFHLTAAAAEAEARGLLSTLICAAYPLGTAGWIAERVSASGLVKAGKLVGRRVAVPDEKIRAQPVSEAIFLASKLLSRAGREALGERVLGKALDYYAHGASKVLRDDPSADIYHYRAGFGGDSVELAKSLGMKAICDGSLVHPALLDYMIDNKGHFPESRLQPELTELWKRVVQDFEAGDIILVNSELVAESYRFMGMRNEVLKVIYLGIDDPFLDKLNVNPRRPTRTRTLLFAGQFGRRKGADTLLAALPLLPEGGWELRIAGTVVPELERPLADAARKFPVRRLGNLTRDRLAAEMEMADIFVFPTLAEGSARVIFEALAAGCVVVTTHNAGSIVEDGVHGRLAPPGDAVALGRILRETMLRSDLHEVGTANARLVRTSFSQRHYGDALARLYSELKANRT